MKKEKKEIKLLDSKNVQKTKTLKVKTYSISDLPEIIEVYDEWVKYNDILVRREYRRANFPEGVSEDLVCIIKDFFKLNQKTVSGCSTSFDCFNPINGERIQVKASSSKYELTSFGPNSVFDKVFFLDFYYPGEGYDKKFKLYEIDSTYINNAWVNKDQTLINQSDEGKRPRIKMRTLIESKSVPFIEYQITKTCIKQIS